MSLSCDVDSWNGYVEVSENFIQSAVSFKCFECYQTVPAFTLAYLVRHWEYDEDGEESDISVRPCCEECGDLGTSVMELGYCWDFGQLRNDIAEDYEESR